MTIEDKKRELCRYRLLVQRIEIAEHIGRSVAVIYEDLKRGCTGERKERKIL